jgi:hypothetical protein
MLFTNGECDLPCFLGINPGATTWNGVIQVLNSADLSYYILGNANGFNPPIYTQLYNENVLYNLTLRKNNGVVGETSFSIVPNSFDLLGELKYPKYELHPLGKTEKERPQ